MGAKEAVQAKLWMITQVRAWTTPFVPHRSSVDIQETTGYNKTLAELPCFDAIALFEQKWYRKGGISPQEVGFTPDLTTNTQFEKKSFYTYIFTHQ